MTTIILQGKKYSEKIISEIKRKVTKMKVKPHLVTISVGNDAATKIYISHKERACMNSGIKFSHVNFQKTTEAKLLTLIDKLNKSKDVHAILVQLPLSRDIDKRKILEAIDPNKDVDGFTSRNKGLLDTGDAKLIPCTAKGIVDLIEEYDLKIAHKHVVVVGTSEVVGMPLSKLLIHKKATVTMCNINTTDLQKHTKEADILICATGHPNLIKKNFVKKNAVVINVGLTRTKEKIIGDVDFDNVKELTQAITPTTGGIGPMTVAHLVNNVLICFDLQKK